MQKVLFFCGEVGLVPGRRIVGGNHGGTDAPEFIRLNPNRTVPVWQANDGVVWESHAILRHLGRTQHALYGGTEAETAQIDQWLDWFAMVFWPPVRGLFLQIWRDRSISWESETGQRFAVQAAPALAIAAAQIETHGNLAGPEFSLADIALAIGLNRLMGLPYPIARPDALNAWHTQVRARPAFAIATENEPDLPGHHARRTNEART